MSQAPAMPIYWDAYLADTTHLTTEEHGAYLLLLAAMWRRGGSVPDDDRDNARIVGLTKAKWKRTKERLRPILTIENGAISQKKLRKTWEKTQEIITKNRRNGALGGRPKAIENKSIMKAIGYVSDNPNGTLQNQNQNYTDSPPTPQGGQEEEDPNIAASKRGRAPPKPPERLTDKVREILKQREMAKGGDDETD